MISLQFGSYDMMINNTLRMFSGQLQIQHDGYLDGQKIRQSVKTALSAPRWWVLSRPMSQLCQPYRGCWLRGGTWITRMLRRSLLAA
jgi:hypothetical protein